MTPDEEPRRPPGVPRRRHLVIGRRGQRREVDRELIAHLRFKEEDLMAAGMSADAAAREARRAFGDSIAVAEECATVWEEGSFTRRSREWWHSVRQDVTVALRGLQRAPVFTTVAIGTLALGIGANTAIFSVIDAVVLRGVPYHKPSGLVAPTLDDASVSKKTLEAIRGRQQTLTSLAAYSRWGFVLTGSGDAEQLHGTAVTADLFSVLGVPAAIGRTFVDGEDRPGQASVVVLGDGLWRSRFGGDSTVVGRVLQLNGRPHTVIGIMPPGFAFPFANAGLYVPTEIDPGDAADYVSGYLLMVGRRRAGVSRDAVATDFRRVVGTFVAEGFGGFKKGDESGVRVPALRDVLVGSLGRSLSLLFGAVAFVLLIACVNVANLLLARASVRNREFAVRASLGAGRGRILRQLIVESLLLAAAGGAAGLLLADGLTRVFATSIPSDAPGATAIGVDARVLAFSLALSMIVGLAFGIAPALRLARADPADGLRDGGRGATTGTHRHRTMRILVVTEFALALMLAVGAGLVLQSFSRLRAVSPGFRTDGILALAVASSDSRFPTPESQAAFFSALFARIGALPGVQGVGAIHLLPLAGGNWNPALVIEGYPVPSNAPPRDVDWRLVTPGYFATMGIPLLSGRLLEDTDRAGTPPVVVVSRTLANRYFPGEDPIGKRVRTFFEAGEFATIVGVVDDTKDQSLAGEARPQMYRTLWQRPQTWMNVLVRSSGNPHEVVAPVRALVRELDPNAPVTGVRLLSDVVWSSIAQPRLMMWLLGAFGALAVVLGTIGIYGVMSYVVQQRLPEIGVRIAMGARPTDIRRLIMGDALRMTAIGLVIGAACAFALTRLLTTQLYAVSVRDPVVFAATVVLLAAVAMLASWLPARRAARSESTWLLRAG